jgi:PhzF family phenazine biosynthesis protein
MHAIAAELGYSETAFITGHSGPGALTVRYFSPLAEVAFCGHATIALTVAVAEHEGSGDLHLTTKAGEVAVEIRQDEAGTILATLTSVPAHTRTASAEEVERALSALRWTAEDLDTRYPVHVAYAGNDHLILAVRDRGTLASLDYDYPALANLMAEKAWTTVMLFGQRHLFCSTRATHFHPEE